jgi:hypothetical protein
MIQSSARCLTLSIGPMLNFLVAMFSLAAVGCATARLGAPPSPSLPQSVLLTERFYVVALSLRNLDPIYVRESERLARICPPSTPEYSECMRRNVASSRERVAPLYSAPRAGSSVSAHMSAFPTINADDGSLRIGMDLELADRPGEFIPWIPDVGDWGYGIHIDGDARVQGGWVQLLHPALRNPAWVLREPVEPTADLYVHVDSIAGHILHLERLKATDRDGDIVTVEPGDFLITHIWNDAIEFRLEVESDFACGDEVIEPAVLPPVFRAHPAEFFNADGRPRFSTKYTKGC